MTDDTLDTNSKIRVGLAVTVGGAILALQGLIFHTQQATQLALAASRLENTQKFGLLDTRISLIEERQRSIITSLEKLNYPWDTDKPGVIQRLTDLEARLLQLERAVK